MTPALIALRVPRSRSGDETAPKAKAARLTLTHRRVAGSRRPVRQRRARTLLRPYMTHHALGSRVAGPLAMGRFIAEPTAGQVHRPDGRDQRLRLGTGRSEDAAAGRRHPQPLATDWSVDGAERRLHGLARSASSAWSSGSHYCSRTWLRENPRDGGALRNPTAALASSPQEGASRRRNPVRRVTTPFRSQQRRAAERAARWFWGASLAIPRRTRRSTPAARASWARSSRPDVLRECF